MHERMPPCAKAASTMSPIVICPANIQLRAISRGIRTNDRVSLMRRDLYADTPIRRYNALLWFRLRRAASHTSHKSHLSHPISSSCPANFSQLPHPLDSFILDDSVYENLYYSRIGYCPASEPCDWSSNSGTGRNDEWRRDPRRRAGT
jgi:hypothetical protein